jgi:outer membrane receptor protein involved in Fe transport
VAETLSGSVLDPAGAPVAGATVRIASALGSPVAQGRTDGAGRFALEVPEGRYSVSVEAPGFTLQQRAAAAPQAAGLTIELTLAVSRQTVTVSSSRGWSEEAREAAPLVSVVERSELLSPAGPTAGHALQGSPGVLVQQTTPGQVSPILRGLTGYQVLNLVDGVRLNNATFRSGPNQYLAFVGQGQLERVEAMLGPASAQYGSDALGGTIQLLTPEPRYASGAGREWHGGLHTFGETGALSAGAGASLAGGDARLWGLGSFSASRYNDLRAGGGADSHNVFRRLFGLQGEALRQVAGSRLPDSGFSQLGAQAKLAWRPGAGQSLTGSYLLGRLDGVRGYHSLLGGLGRMQARFDPQVLQLAYARYERVQWGAFDSVSGAVSLNSQRDGSVRQGLRSSGTVTTDRTAVDAYGYSGQAATHLGRRHAVVFGGEIYDERIGSTRRETNPVSGAAMRRRPLYPDGSRWVTRGAFVQDNFEIVPGRLRAQAGLRFTEVSYRTGAAPDFGVAASHPVFRDATFHAAAVWQAAPAFSIHLLTGRGFRAPNANDLGAIGLNDLGYEIPSADAVKGGALLATSAGENALSSGRTLGALGPERMWNYEIGFRVQTRRVYTRLHLFDAELRDPIMRRTLLFPAASIPAALAGLPVTPIPPTAAQREQGVVTVATSIDPRAVKAFVNDGQTRYYGSEAQTEYRFARHWTLEGAHTFLAGRDLNPNRNVRRLPPQSGYAALRFAGAGRWWGEFRADVAGTQTRLSGGDLDDERIGAARSRRDIADFFHGSRVQPYLAGGVFTPTGERLAEIQARVLPGALSDTARIPMYRRTPGWVSFQVRGGFWLGERTVLHGAVTNLLDRNYRMHGSGVDAPGAAVSLALSYRF